MNIAQNTYVPALKWRRGEYQALLRLSDAAKAQIVPFLTIPRIEYDFEDEEPKKTVQEHVEKFAKRYVSKWNMRPAWLEVDASIQTAKMDSGLDVITHVFSELRELKAHVVPVVTLDDDSEVIASIAAAVSIDGRGMALRTRLEHLMHPGFARRAAHLLQRVEVEEADTDLIVDLGSPAYEPYKAFAAALTTALSRIPSLDIYRSFVLIGTAFPPSIKDVVVPGGAVSRHDWLFYKEFIANLPKSMRRPAFGDYTIVSPAFAADFDMRKIKPAGKVIYTAGDQWTIRKGGAFRDNSAQMHGHCAHIVALSDFRGETYSSGDEYIARCARKEVGPSTLTRWKEVGINHHITRVLEDLSSFRGPS